VVDIRCVFDVRVGDGAHFVPDLKKKLTRSSNIEEGVPTTA
jgi:hypothetical protein